MTQPLNNQADNDVTVADTTADTSLNEEETETVHDEDDDDMDIDIDIDDLMGMLPPTLEDAKKLIPRKDGKEEEENGEEDGEEDGKEEEYDDL